MKYDIVYLLKNDVKANELKYSLRSVEKNFPHQRVWFFGGCPKGIKPDRYVEVVQTGNNKWEKSTSSLRKACETEELTEFFWLFNDDFFILEKVDDLPCMVQGKIQKRINELRRKYGRSEYSNQLELMWLNLEQRKLPTLDYAVHTPMLINKGMALEVFSKFPNCPMFRCLYGNYWHLDAIEIEDVKIYDLPVMPKEGQKLVSTIDEVFDYGRVGQYIIEKFKEPSKWEV